MNDWASTAHLPDDATCAGCGHVLALHDGEQQQCQWCVCDGFVVSASDAPETLERAEPNERPELWDHIGIQATPESKARNAGNRRRADALRAK